MKIKTLFFLLLCFCLFFPTIIFAIEINAEKQKNFALNLYQQKEFYRAITEYKRFLHFFPQENSQEIHANILQSYLAGQDHQGAIDYLLQLEVEQPELVWSDRMKFLYSLAYLDKDNHRLYHYRRGNIKNGVSILKTINTDYFAEAKNFELDLATISQESEQKNPVIAGSLSAILPGAGSYYNERYKEALYSFLITSLFFAASIEAKNNEKATNEALFSFFALAFYGGNIYTAINGAYKHNDNLETRYFNNLRVKYNLVFRF